MPQTPQGRPAPKVPATTVPPPEQATGAEHVERLIDEALDESFPASDPPAMPQDKGKGKAKTRKP